MNNFKIQPDNNWLINLESHTIKDKKLINISGPWYGECGEDGVLDYMFDYIKETTSHAVDIGAGMGNWGSNVRHIVDKYNWDSTEMDGRDWPNKHPAVKNEWFTPDNICSLFEKYNTPKEFDLLSLDIDSMDYHILEKILIGGYRPSVAIIEFNPIFDYNESYVRVYDAGYKKDSTSNYGASINAFNILMKLFNYSLVHVFGNIKINEKGIATPDSIQSNNLLFLHNKFISVDTKITPIEQLHPVPWIETWKTKNNICGFGDDLSNIKESLINNSFVELEREKI